METKNFFSKIREIIREEIEYALDKKLSEKKTKIDDIATPKHGISMYNESQKLKKVTKPTSQKTEFASIKELLAETKRSLQESMEYDDEINFTSDMAEGFGNERVSSAIPHGYNASDVSEEVMSALTKDYSALMKKIDEKKGR